MDEEESNLTESLGTILIIKKQQEKVWRSKIRTAQQKIEHIHIARGRALERKGELRQKLNVVCNQGGILDRHQLNLLHVDISKLIDLDRNCNRELDQLMLKEKELLAQIDSFTKALNDVLRNQEKITLVLEEIS